MLILSEFQIEFALPGPTAMVALLHLHSSLLPRLRSGNELLVESLGVPFPPNTVVPSTDYIDSFGNRCARFLAPRGHLRLSGSNIVEAESSPDVQYPVQSRCRLRIFPQRFCGFSCRADIARLTSSAPSPTINSDPPRADGNGRLPSAIGYTTGDL
jgi:hypothetical protein